MTNFYSISDSIPHLEAGDLRLCLEEKLMTYTNTSLRNYLHSIKEEIDKYAEEWDRHKKYMNPYEFINTPYDSNTPSVCSYRPISRAYFKMVEILNTFPFHFPRMGMKCFHLAEGPGGFIEAMVHYRKNRNDVYHGMTLMDDSEDVPRWSKSENFITADGGFDFSLDFNKQEENSLRLIFAEVLFALIMQKKGGAFVLKMYDTFSSASLEMIYLLNYFYEDVSFVKPLSSRPANSEKYVVCINFKEPTNLQDILHELIQMYIQMNHHHTAAADAVFSHLFKEPLPSSFLEKMKEINSIFGQSQIENIMSTLTSIYEAKPQTATRGGDFTKRSHLNKCVK
jgi:23S rRNA U2552 (ribose-2'-O)-methylase RlmE/FtsJ